MTMFKILLVAEIKIPEDAFGYFSFEKDGGINETGKGVSNFFEVLSRHPQQERIYLQDVRRKNGNTVCFNQVSRDEAMKRIFEIIFEYADESDSES